MRYKETETVELKKSTSALKEALISISTILNKHGAGVLYFGIQDDGTVAGQQIGKSTLKDISKSITDYIDPQIYPPMQYWLTFKNCRKPMPSEFVQMINVKGNERRNSAGRGDSFPLTIK